MLNAHWRCSHSMKSTCQTRVGEVIMQSNQWLLHSLGIITVQLMQLRFITCTMHPIPIKRTYPLTSSSWPYYPNVILLTKLFQLNGSALVQVTSGLERGPRFIVTCKKTVGREKVETSLWIWRDLNPKPLAP